MTSNSKPNHAYKTFEQYSLDTPEPQLKGKFNYQAIDVTDKDPYDCTEASNNYDQFIDALKKLEDEYTAAHPDSAQPKNNERIQACKTNTRLPYTTAPEGRKIRAEIIFKLLAQEDYGFILSIDELLAWLEKLLGKGHYKLITKTRSNIAQYKKEFDSRNDHILHRETVRKEITVTNRKKYRFPFLFSIPSALLSLIERHTESEKKIVEEKQVYSTPFGQAAGGLPYLAVISHSVSRRLLHPEIADALAKQIPNKSVKHAISVKKCK